MTDSHHSEVPAKWQRGRRLGLDVGTARIGVASCDPDGILATPVESIRVTDGAPRWKNEISRIAELIVEYEPVAIVVGVPISLRGRATASTEMANSLITKVAAADLGVKLVAADERLSTVSATAALRASGKKSRAHRAIIDQAAAVVILQTWLDAHRARSE